MQGADGLLIVESMPQPARSLRFALAMVLLAACQAPQRQLQNPEERYIYAPPEPCADVPLLTSEQDARAAVDAGSEVAVEGVPVPSDSVECTAKGCFEDDPCCNECHNFGGHRVTLRGPDGAPFVVGMTLGGCGGPQCDMSCQPFGRHPQTRYRFVGKVHEPLRDKWVMKVERFCRASP